MNSPTLLSALLVTTKQRHWPVCQERKGRKGKVSKGKMARKVFALGYEGKVSTARKGR